MNGLEIFKALNWLMSQYRKNNCGRVLFQNTFTSFRNDPFLEIDSIAVAKMCWNFLMFSKHLFCKNMYLWAHLRNTINQLHVNETWPISAFISFMAAISWIANVRHQTCKLESVRIKQPLNWIRLIQVGNIQGCFIDSKLYFSLSKLIQSLFKSVFI